MARRRRSVRFSDTEWNNLKRQAQREGRSVSSLLRRRAFGPRVGAVDRRALPSHLIPIHKEARATGNSEPLCVQRTVRFTEDDWSRVRESAELLGLAPTRYLRFAVLAQPMSGQLKDTAVRHLARIANQLDPLTEEEEFSEELPRGRLEETLAAVEAAIRSLR